MPEHAQRRLSCSTIRGILLLCILLLRKALFVLVYIRIEVLHASLHVAYDLQHLERRLDDEVDEAELGGGPVRRLPVAKRGDGQTQLALPVPLQEELVQQAVRPQVGRRKRPRGAADVGRVDHPLESNGRVLPSLRVRPRLVHGPLAQLMIVEMRRHVSAKDQLDGQLPDRGVLLLCHVGEAPTTVELQGAVRYCSMHVLVDALVVVSNGQLVSESDSEGICDSWMPNIMTYGGKYRRNGMQLGEVVTQHNMDALRDIGGMQPVVVGPLVVLPLDLPNKGVELAEREVAAEASRTDDGHGDARQRTVVGDDVELEDIEVVPRVELLHLLLQRPRRPHAQAQGVLPLDLAVASQPVGEDDRLGDLTQRLPRPTRRRRCKVLQVLPSLLVQVGREQHRDEVVLAAALAELARARLEHVEHEVHLLLLLGPEHALLQQSLHDGASNADIVPAALWHIGQVVAVRCQGRSR
mmetsp:Transcript_29226/g.83013  ORF Transcript_29226/g.83013 Transcript_29226/m.83013 type:complete len:467 (-) Transcript_29226:184-1584(-)